MTILSYGFDGSLAEKEFSILMTLSDAPGGSGGTGTVSSLSDFNLTPVTGYRSYTVDPGTSYAAGVMAVSDAQETITLPAPTAWGQWHLLVLRRDWSANTTKFVTIPSDEVSQMPGSIPATDPGDLRASPGIIHDHKIGWALVQKATTGVTLYRICQLAPWLRKTRGTTAERDTYVGSPGSGIGQRIVNGSSWYNTDGEWEERYLAARSANGSQLDVARPAGWYPVSGHMPLIEFIHDNGYNQSVPTGTSETTLLGYSNTGRNYWGNGGFGEPQLGIGYNGLGIFAVGLPGRWEFNVCVNFANVTSGTFRAIGFRTGSQGLISFSRVNASASGVWLQISGVWNVPAGGDTFWVTAAQDSNAALSVHVNQSRVTYLGPN